MASSFLTHSFPLCFSGTLGVNFASATKVADIVFWDILFANIQAGSVLPRIALVALYRKTIVFGEATYASDLSAVVLLINSRRRLFGDGIVLEQR